jgi:Mn2+/Fe2+ NRAMP family transporter
VTTRSYWKAIGPGILLAATGIGAGDLTTATFAGSLLGTTVLWAIAVGAFLKFVVTEGLARWQLATGETLLEGLVSRVGPVAIWIFLPYLFLWTFFVAAALMSGCGVALHAAIPIFDDARTGKIVFGAVAGVLGLVLVMHGGYRLFEKVMRVCVGIMFATVIATAVALRPDLREVASGFVPSMPASAEGVAWTVALIGGIGGTVTVLCYG